MERPAAIERFIMELLADPEPPPVSRPEVLLSRSMYDTQNVGGFYGLWAAVLTESLCVGNLRVSFRAEHRLYFLQNRFKKVYNMF